MNGSSSPASTHTLSFLAQSAYRKMHSCTLLVSLDLRAAFDTIDHNILLNKLCTRFGITGSPLAWLTSYLSSRTQCVCVCNASSAVTDCHTGVPQGSVLGPILFSVYISPIADLVLQYGVSYMLPQLCLLLSPASFFTLLVLSQWSRSEPQQIGGNNIWHSPTPQLLS